MPDEVCFPVFPVVRKGNSIRWLRPHSGRTVGRLFLPLSPFLPVRPHFRRGVQEVSDRLLVHIYSLLRLYASVIPYICARLCAKNGAAVRNDAGVCAQRCRRCCGKTGGALREAADFVAHGGFFRLFETFPVLLLMNQDVTEKAFLCGFLQWETDEMTALV